MSKVLERALLGPLHTMIYPKIHLEQYAFRDEYSITTQLINLTDSLCVNANSKKCTTAVFLNIEKAFNHV